LVVFSETLQLDSGEIIADRTMRLPEKFNSCMQQKELSTDLQTNVEENTCLICTFGGKLLWVTFSSGFHTAATRFDIS
jgi:hypothetical protein